MHNPNCDCTVEDCEANPWTFIKYDEKDYPILCICEHGNIILDDRDDLKKIEERYGH